MWLIVGLGNPGQRYHLTRHNIGCIVIDLLAKQHQIKVVQHKFHSLFGSGRIGNESILLAKPLTYMNRSGVAIQEMLIGFDVDLTDLIIISDDFHLPIGDIRVRRQGSAGGHHGLESIIENLGSTQFTRLRIGIGEPEGEDIVEYVLGTFARNEMDIVKESTEKAMQAVNVIIEQGINVAMNQFNKKSVRNSAE